MESETFLSLSRSAECRNAIYRVNGRVTAQPTESGGDCFSRFLCLLLVCAVSVLHILCLCWLKLSSQWKNTHWVQGLSHHVYVWSLIPQHNSMTSYMVSKQTMEVDPTYSIMTELKKKASADNSDKTVKNLIWLFFDTSLLTSFFNLDEPTQFA